MNVINKKIIILSFFLLLSVGFVACKKNLDKGGINSSTLKSEGKTIDISDKNNSLISVRAGDMLYLLLSGNKEDKYQWSLREPVSGGYLSLVKHINISENDTRLKEGEILSEWKFRVEKDAMFPLRLDYENPMVSQEAKNVFRLKVVSDRTDENIPFIILDSPQEKQDVSSGKFMISGYAKVYEGTVQYRLQDMKDKILEESYIQALHGGPDYGYFEKEITFISPQTPEGVLKVFEINAEDGSEKNVVSVNVSFDPSMIPIKVFFNNAKLDPEISCNKVFGVQRYIKKSDNISFAKNALIKLFSGPSPEEISEGYFTNVPKISIKINSVTIDNEVIRADFGKALQEGVGGSCRVISIRSQIEETLKEVSGLQKVIISIDGRTEDILQP